jgi:hypothetical protein
MNLQRFISYRITTDLTFYEKQKQCIKSLQRDCAYVDYVTLETKSVDVR